MRDHDYLSFPIEDLLAFGYRHSGEYLKADPFPHIVLDNFFSDSIISAILEEFPDLSSFKDGVIRFHGSTDIKLATDRGDSLQGETTKSFLRFLNSVAFLDFVRALTGINEILLPDPYFSGGGLHEIKRGGFLKMHTDFSTHPSTGLDRRVNLLLYLNPDWQEVYGGKLELWNSEMTECRKAVSPVLNRMVVFNTHDFSYHGHPEPLLCPDGASRKSIALYYYSNGRPSSEVKNNKSTSETVYKRRPGETFVKVAKRKLLGSACLSSIAKDICPPIVFRMFR